LRAFSSIHRVRGAVFAHAFSLPQLSIRKDGWKCNPDLFEPALGRFLHPARRHHDRHDAVRILPRGAVIDVRVYDFVVRRLALLSEGMGLCLFIRIFETCQNSPRCPQIGKLEKGCKRSSCRPDPRLYHFGHCLVSKLGDKQSAWQFPFNVGHREQFFSTLQGVCF
jgi:hypothetical protein